MSPIGQVGSIAHILTNQKISDKKSAIKDCYLSALKSSGKMIGVSAAIGGAAAAGVKLSPKFAGYVSKGINFVKDKLAQVSVGGKSLLDSVKESSLAKKVNSLPAWAKAGIAVGAAALAAIRVLDYSGQASKVGATEAKYEDK